MADEPRQQPAPVGALLAETIDGIAARAEADDAATRWWYGFGRRVGHHEGYAAAVADLDADRETAARNRARAAAPAVAAADQPTYAELARRRGEA